MKEANGVWDREHQVGGGALLEGLGKPLRMVTQLKSKGNKAASCTEHWGQSTQAEEQVQRTCGRSSPAHLETVRKATWLAEWARARTAPVSLAGWQGWVVQGPTHPLEGVLPSREEPHWKQSPDGICFTCKNTLVLSGAQTGEGQELKQAGFGKLLIIRERLAQGSPQ